MNHPEEQYLNTLKDILEHGEKVPNRTGVDTLRILGVTHRYDFKHGFPLLTTKKVWFRGVAHELLWFLSGSTNIKYLVDNGVNIWNDDAYGYFLKLTKKHYAFLRMSPLSKEVFLSKLGQNFDGISNNGKKYVYGDLGPVYGAQWRRWRRWDANNCAYDYDQIQNLVDGLKNNPSSRRHILTAWNVGEIEDMGLPPCHVLSQYTISNGKLWCHMYQRSCDTFLGVPFNIASYSLLTYMLAHVCGLEPGGFIWTGHDVHIYENHIPAVEEQLQREPYQFPQLKLNPDVKYIDDFKYEDIEVVGGYRHHPKIKAELVT